MWRLFAGGARLIFTEGWDAVAHLPVAAEASIGRATLCRHWPTVEDLPYDVLVECQTPLEVPETTADLCLNQAGVPRETRSTRSDVRCPHELR